MEYEFQSRVSTQEASNLRKKAEWNEVMWKF